MELRNGGLEPLVVYDQILFIWVVALDQVLVRNIALVFLVGHNKLFYMGHSATTLGNHCNKLLF